MLSAAAKGTKLCPPPWRVQPLPPHAIRQARRILELARTPRGECLALTEGALDSLAAPLLSAEPSPSHPLDALWRAWRAAAAANPLRWDRARERYELRR